MRLIDADDFLDLFYVMAIGQDKAFIKAVEQVVSDTPTVDTVEVVRCKDCKHKSVYCTTVDCNMRTIYSCFCILHGTYHEQDWFCADGERR